MNRRERRMQETAAALTSVSRRLTTERGLAGFTIEELCDEVDVSRRTFFNYFASKEDAVIGVNPDDESRRFGEEFLAGGARGWRTVVDDLVGLAVAHFEEVGVDALAHADFVASLEREPKLFARFMGVTRERERQLVALICEREGADADDERALAVVSIVSTLFRTSADRFIAPGNTLDLPSILHSSLAALRTVLTTPHPRKGTL